jgi:tRNA nucleotidyltransferase (CCA-adding enzyme)
MAATPSRMLDVLRDSNALAPVMPGLQVDASTDAELDRAAAAGLPLAGRYALLCRASPDRAALAARLRVPTDCADQARLLPDVLTALAADPPAASDAAHAARLDLLERCDALRKPERFLELLRAANAVRPVDLDTWSARLQAVRGIDAGAIARACGGDAGRIKQALRDARLMALAGLG